MPKPTETHTVWHWNVAGSTLHDGSVTDGMVDAVVTSVLAQEAGLISLNELCLQQFGAVQARLLAAGWPQDPVRFSAFEPTLEGASGVCAGQPFGIGLFSRTPVGEVEPTVLPDDGSVARRALLCAVVGPTSAVRFCTTHVTTSSLPASGSGLASNAAQLQAVLDRLEGHAATGETVLLAGDLNAQSHYGRLDGWYDRSLTAPAHGGNTGRYRELDDADSRCPGYGEATALGPPGAAPPCAGGAKVDHVFVRSDRVAGPYRADVLDIPYRCADVPELPGVRAAGACSDHAVLIGTVTVCVRR